VFRIVQEGVAKAAKHARAARAWVEIGRRGADRLVMVRDVGSGFEPSEDAAARGVRNIRQRVAAIGGAFSLRTLPAGGLRSRSSSDPSGPSALGRPPGGRLRINAERRSDLCTDAVQPERPRQCCACP
jgi:hypothetical protein